MRTLENLAVTGGLGFIGSNFIHHALHSQKEIRITNIDYKGWGSNSANVRDLRRDKRYRFVLGDIADWRFVQRALKNIDVVVNFAAQTHVDRSISGPNLFFESNARGAFNLFQSALKNQVRKVVHISTDEVYGSIASGSFTEEDALNPSSPYSSTKAAADLMARAWNTTFQLPVTILRCTNNFGPRQHPEKFIPKTIIRAMNGDDIPLYGRGNQIRDWIFVDDFCSAIEKVISQSSASGLYNISAGSEINNSELAQRVLKQLSSENVRIVNVEDRPGHDFRYSLNSERARSTFGWKPEHSLEEGLALTVKWYKENEQWWKPLATKKVLSSTPWREKW